MRMKKIRSGLKELAQKRGISIRQIAREIDMEKSWESVRRFANNETSMYSRELLERLINRYGFKLEELLVVEEVQEAKD